MTPSDIPHEDTLRDLLWRKIRNPTSWQIYDMSAYHSLSEGAAKKTYQTLRDTIRGYIERQTEDKMLLYVIVKTPSILLIQCMLRSTLSLALMFDICWSP